MSDHIDKLGEVVDAADSSDDFAEAALTVASAVVSAAEGVPIVGTFVTPIRDSIRSYPFASHQPS